MHFTDANPAEGVGMQTANNEVFGLFRDRSAIGEVDDTLFDLSTQLQLGLATKGHISE